MLLNEFAVILLISMKTVKTEVDDANSSDIVSIVHSTSMFHDGSIQERASVIGIYSHFCPSCSKEFENKQLLTRHLMIHSQSGPFPCDYCTEELEDRSSLRAHWRTCHGGEGSHMCNTCGEALENKTALQEHMDVHERAKKHRCVDCGKAFSYKSDLRKHMIIHTGLRPYVCPICCKSFTRSTNLNKHQRLHSGYRPFSCSQCPKSFSCKGDLVRHQIIHTGVKPYSCSVCTLSFSRKDKLTKHEKMHNGGVPPAYTCPACPATFTRKEELTKHSQFAHFSPGMDGFLMYVNELVKGTEGSKQATSLSSEPNIIKRDVLVTSESIIPSDSSSQSNNNLQNSNVTECSAISFGSSTEIALRPPSDMSNLSDAILVTSTTTQSIILTNESPIIVTDE